MKVSNLGGAAAELPESAECFSAKGDATLLTFFVRCTHKIGRRACSIRVFVRFSFHSRSVLESVSSLRSILCQSGICGSMPFALTIQPSVGDVPKAVSPFSHCGMMSSALRPD